MATIASPDDFGLQHLQAAAQFYAKYYEANRPAIEYAGRLTSQMKPYLEVMAPTVRAVQRLQQDLNLAAILVSLQTASTDAAWVIPLPTEIELAETQDRLPELVPETEDQRDQISKQAAEIEADPQGKKVIEQITSWVSESIKRMVGVATNHRTAVGLILLAYACLFGVSQAEVDRAALFCVAAAAWLMIFPPSDS